MELRSFLQYLQYEKRYSSHTITAYENDLLQLIAYLDKTYELRNPDDVRHTHIRSWIVSLMDDKIGARSINRKMSSLKTYFKFQLKNGFMKHNPMTKVMSPKTAKRLPVFIQSNQLQTMWKHHDFGSGFSGVRNKLIMEIFYGTGMRVSELVNLKDASFNFHGSSVKVLGKGNKERIIPLNPELKEMIKEYISMRNKIFDRKYDLFLVNDKGAKIYSRYVYRIVNETLQKVTTVEKKSPHVMRHTFATHLLNNGAEINAIKELLGHASLAATQVYTHNTIEKLKDVYKKAHPKAQSE